MKNKTETATTITLDGTLLFIVFLILKLTHVIDWSWWWVTSPLWIPWVIVLGFGALLLAGWLVYLLWLVVAAIFEWVMEWRIRRRWRRR